jgi:hypothetical protein
MVILYYSGNLGALISVVARADALVNGKAIRIEGRRKHVGRK